MADIAPTAGSQVPPAEVEEVELYHAKSFWTKYIFSQDAKVIAIQYSSTAIGIGLVGLVLSWMMRLQLGFPDSFTFIDATDYYQFITIHGMIMVIYLLTALFLGGFGNYLIPLMVGARDMVFPYVNMISYWVYLVAVAVLVVSFFVPGGPTGAGWTLYPPQAILPGTPGADAGSGGGIVLMLVSLALFIIGFTMGGLNYVVTVLQARTRGMTLMRMPLTIWGIFVATVLALLAFPALFVGAVMMTLDRLLGTSFFMPTIVQAGEQLAYGGGSPILFQHLFWFFGHPEVYIVALPAFGIVSDLISVHARRHIFGYRMMVWAIVIIGGLSFIVWAHHMYVSGMNPWFGFFFATTTLIIAVPTALKVYNWTLTLWRANINLTLPMLFALAFIVTFVNGGITGLFLGNVVVDVPLSDTMFVVAHFHMVMGVAPILVVFGAIYHWFPLMTGRMLNEGMGQFHFWVTFLGAYTIFLPIHYLGLLGVPRRYFEMGETGYIPASAHDLNAFITVVTLIVGVAQIVFFINIFWSMKNGKLAGKNPWKAASLEWQTPEVPPGHGNFGKELPLVYRWAYDYGVPGAPDDFIAQDQPGSSEGGASHVNLFQELTKKPWLETGAPDGPEGGSAEGFALPRSTLGLRVFMVVVTVVFSLFIVSYSDRMLIADWKAMPEPWLLWANTAILVLASAALHWATLAARRERLDEVKTGLMTGAAFSLAFITGQLFVWQTLVAEGYFAASNPANAFFYVLTALHGLHLLGGIGALGLTFSRIRRGAEVAEISQAVDLCAVYWHFLFVVWLVVFGLLLFT